MKKCPLCGKENDVINSVCANCGTDLGYQNQALYEVYKRVDNMDKALASEASHVGSSPTGNIFV